MTATVLSVVAIVGTAFGIIWTVRAQRRLVAAQVAKTAQEAGSVQDGRVATLQRQVAVYFEENLQLRRYVGQLADVMLRAGLEVPPMPALVGEV